MLIPILAYAVVLKVYADKWFGWKTAAVLAVLIPYLIVLTLEFIRLAGYNISLWQAFSPNNLITFAAQLFAAILLFSQLERYEESLSIWALGGIAGVAVLFFVIPGLVGMVVPR